MDVADGSVAALVGRNGSGKTTLLRIAAGTLAPDSGAVTVGDGQPGRGQAGHVPAGDRMLNFRLTGRQNLEFYARLCGTARRDVRLLAEAAAEALDAGDLLEARTGECSTGQRRRLMLAAGVIGRPPVLLLDEPMADLDDIGRTIVSTLVERWRDAGGAIVCVAPSSGELPTADLHFSLLQGRLEART
jgi:ABC-type multidrug transport system ATPase subunit